MRYFKHYNNAMTMMQRAGRMNRPSLFGFRGFGQTDPVLDAAPDAGDVAADSGVTDAEAIDAAATGAGAAVAEPPVSTITFYPDGSIVRRGAIGNTMAPDWWQSMESALGVPDGEGRSADGLYTEARELYDSKRMWKLIALIGIPAVGLGAWYAAKKL